MDVNTTNSEVLVTGNLCKRGMEYAITEATAPRRTLTTTIRVNIGGKKSVAPVKTKGDIPKDLIFEAMKAINNFELKESQPIGTAIITNLLETGIDIVLTDDA